MPDRRVTEEQFREGRELLLQPGSQPNELRRAAELFRLAAEAGHAGAQSNLGVLYRQGRGVPQSDLLAAQWFRRAAEHGNAVAQDNLGVLLTKGAPGVPADLTEAGEWHRRSAEQGLAQSQLHLALLLIDRRQKQPDYAQARQWLEKAAAQRETGAWNTLGVIEEEGWGGAPSLAQAAHLYKLAAEAGDAMGQANYGRLLATGQGVALDPSGAYQWLTLSARQGEPAGRNFLYDYITNLTPEQVQEGKKRVAEYLANKSALGDQPR